MLIFGVLVGIAMFQSVTMQESAMEPTLQVGERFFVNRAIYKVSRQKGVILLYIRPVEVMMRLYILAV